MVSTCAKHFCDCRHCKLSDFRMLPSSMPWLLKITGSKSGRRKLEDIPVMTDQVTCGVDITRFGAVPYLGHE